MKLQVDKIYFLSPWRRCDGHVRYHWTSDFVTRKRVIQVLLSEPYTKRTYDVDGYIKYNEGTNAYSLGIANVDMRVRERPTVPTVRPAGGREWNAVVNAVSRLVKTVIFIQNTYIKSLDYKYKTSAYLLQVASVVPAAYVVLSERLDRLIEYTTRPDSEWTKLLEQRQMRGLLGK